MTMKVNTQLLKQLVKEAKITLVVKHFAFSYDFCQSLVNRTEVP